MGDQGTTDSFMCSDQALVCCGQDGKGPGYGDSSFVIIRHFNGTMKAVGSLSGTLRSGISRSNLRFRLHSVDGHGGHRLI